MFGGPRRVAGVGQGRDWRLGYGKPELLVRQSCSATTRRPSWPPTACKRNLSGWLEYSGACMQRSRGFDFFYVSRCGRETHANLLVPLSARLSIHPSVGDFVCRDVGGRRGGVRSRL